MKRFVKHKAFGKFAQTTRLLKRDTSGNIAIMTAVLGVVFAGGLALAIDMSQAYFAKQRLQATTDSIALLAAKDSLKSQADLTAAAQAYFDFTYPGAKGERIELIDIQRDGDTVRLSARNNIDAYFARVWGKNSMDVSVVSEATYANKALDIALVLDTTGSMRGTKMNALKAAANNLVDTLEGSGNENLRMSVIPFSQYVNVGLSRRYEPWLDVPDDSTTTGEEVCRMRRDVVSRSNCRTVAKTCRNDGVAYECDRQVCDTEYGPEYESCSVPTYRARWNGCVGSRDVPLDTDAPYAGRQIPGLLNVKCGTEIQDLTKNLRDVKSTVRKLRADGDTYMPAGLVWGWRALDREQPLASSAPRGVTDTERVLVLMTDGENTRSKTDDRHNGYNKNAADDTTRILCNNIKGEKITVYTIAYDITDNSTRTLVSSCATDSSKFFSATNAADLDAAFQEIAASLNDLRLTI
ncbi:VWA domain-containing protein [Litorimonas sp. RW-G-Af-16]|uniref:VWA domain-containing protein n=1 Tax=Litorimonas sp. RW-G-Af-16 TaxID=3241168 RepID=UPI00390C9CC2